MENIKIKEAKILMGIPIAIFSLEAYLGMVAGYFLANFGSPRIKSLVFTIGKYRLHLHHWILGSICLILISIYNFSPIPMSISSGFLGGMIFQGLCYEDWHKILIKQS